MQNIPMNGYIKWFRLQRQKLISSILATVLLTGCSLDSLVRVDDPDAAELVDRDRVNSYTGALAVYYSAIGSMMEAVNAASRDVGIFTDELTIVTNVSSSLAPTDSRNYSGVHGLTSNSYSLFQTARIRSAQASELLLRYGSEASHPFVGNAYAIQAYSTLMLAEIFCSGVPLTTSPFENNVQYTRGFSTSELLEQAVALFDTAYQYGQDSIPIASFAMTGKGRALLGLGEYAAAAEAVTDVPTSSSYVLTFSTLSSQGGISFWDGVASYRSTLRVVNGEGTNGIDWIADSPAYQDPRLPLSASLTDHRRQEKYVGGSVKLQLSSGAEARLIESEAYLHSSDSPGSEWLASLNEARALVSLPDTVDPGTPEKRIDLVFRERALWTYLTGKRLGDLRRLVRNYNRLTQSVYPVGTYLSSALIFTYGNELVFVPDQGEVNLNPEYDGCIHKNA